LQGPENELVLLKLRESALEFTKLARLDSNRLKERILARDSQIAEVRRKRVEGRLLICTDALHEADEKLQIVSLRKMVGQNKKGSAVVCQRESRWQQRAAWRGMRRVAKRFCILRGVESPIGETVNREVLAKRGVRSGVSRDRPDAP
jgi:hypothetical protein